MSAFGQGFLNGLTFGLFSNFPFMGCFNFFPRCNTYFPFFSNFAAFSPYPMFPNMSNCCSIFDNTPQQPNFYPIFPEPNVPNFTDFMNFSWNTNSTNNAHASNWMVSGFYNQAPYKQFVGDSFKKSTPTKTVAPTVSKTTTEVAEADSTIKKPSTKKKIPANLKSTKGIKVENKIHLNNNNRKPGGEASKYDSLITKYSEKYNVDANLIKAVMRQESQFNPTAKSPVGAYGLMQLIPDTAKILGVNRYDIEQNIEGGAKFLRQLLDRFDGNATLAIAAYNAGPNRDCYYRGEIPDNNETKGYVQYVTGYFKEYSA